MNEAIAPVCSRSKKERDRERQRKGGGGIDPFVSFPANAPLVRTSTIGSYNSFCMSQRVSVSKSGRKTNTERSVLERSCPSIFHVFSPTIICILNCFHIKAPSIYVVTRNFIRAKYEIPVCQNLYPIISLFSNYIGKLWHKFMKQYSNIVTI